MTNSENDQCIWMSSAQISGTHQKVWNTMDLPDKRNAYMTPDFYKLSERSERSEVLSATDLPASFFEPKSRKPAQRPNYLHLFCAGLIFVSPESAEVLRDFDIAPGILKPVTLYKSDKVTEMLPGFCILNIAAKKNAFLPEQSEGAREAGVPGRWSVTPNPRLQTSTFSTAALDGADVWRDERVRSKFFISDRLYKALNAQGLAKDWYVVRCPIV